MRQLLEEQNITAYIPIHTRHETSVVSTGEFVYHGDHLVCPQGKILHRGSFHKRSRTYQYVARQKDCQACPVKDTCLQAKQKRRYFALTMYYPEYLRAKERNQTEEYRQELRRRQTIAEGTFASLDRLSWARTRLRSFWKVDCEGYMAALAHNVKKFVRQLSRGVGPPEPALPTAAKTAGTTETQGNRGDAVPNSPIPPQYRLRQRRLTRGPSLQIRRSHCRRR